MHHVRLPATSRGLDSTTVPGRLTDVASSWPCIAIRSDGCLEGLVGRLPSCQLDHPRATGALPARRLNYDILSATYSTD